MTSFALRPVLAKAGAGLFLAAVVGTAAWRVFSGGRPSAAGPSAGSVASAPDAAGHRHEALWWTPLPGGEVQCTLCPNACRLRDGRIGLCRVRQNIDGTDCTSPVQSGDVRHHRLCPYGQDHGIGLQ